MNRADIKELLRDNVAEIMFTKKDGTPKMTLLKKRV